MKSNYKRIGDYIELVDVRNKELKVTTLLGLSITKQFIPSVANTVGTNMRNYKIIKNNQFACSIMQVRRDKKMPVALLKDLDEAIISQAYPVFEINKPDKLLPDYLMMWFTRAEFDRHAEFLAVGGVRGSLEWEDFLDMTLPVPSLEKQQEIVNDYNTVQERITINEQLNTALEATAQALYKHWFVDFEFPTNLSTTSNVSSSAVENGSATENSLSTLGYKSSGGAMVYNEELDNEIPEGWDVVTVKEFCKEMKSGGTPSRSNYTFWDERDIPWIKTGELRNSVIFDTEEYISSKGLMNSSAKLLPINTVLIAMYGQGNTKGQVAYLKVEATTNQACCAMICYNEIDATFLYNHLRLNRRDIVSVAIGGAQPNLSKEIIENLKLLRPKDALMTFHPFVELMASKENNTREIFEFKGASRVLLSKMATVVD